MTVVGRQTAYRMRHCCARRIDKTGGRRKLLRTSTRWAERQRIVGAEANRLAMLTRLRCARGTFTSETSELFKPETANLSLSLGVPKGIFSFAKENIPFAPAARRRHILRTCAKPIASFIYNKR